jgi:hypothetical protein
MYSLYENEYRIFKPVKTTIKMGQVKKKKNKGDEPNGAIIYICICMYIYILGGTTRKLLL